MKRFLWLGAILLGFPFLAAAQETTRVEVFTGYCWLRADVGKQFISMSGFNAELALNANPWLALVGDFSINVAGPRVVVGTNFNTESFLAGPQIASHHGRIRLFARALFGGNRFAAKAFTTPTVTTSNTSLAWALGGGINIPVNDWVDLRAVQADYLGAHHFGKTQNNIRLAFGFNFHFGKK